MKRQKGEINWDLTALTLTPWLMGRPVFRWLITILFLRCFLVQASTLRRHNVLPVDTRLSGSDAIDPNVDELSVTPKLCAIGSCERNCRSRGVSYSFRHEV